MQGNVHHFILELSCTYGLMNLYLDMETKNFLTIKFLCLHLLTKQHR